MIEDRRRPITIHTVKVTANSALAHCEHWVWLTERTGHNSVYLIFLFSVNAAEVGWHASGAQSAQVGRTPCGRLWLTCSVTNRWLGHRRNVRRVAYPCLRSYGRQAHPRYAFFILQPSWPCPIGSLLPNDDRSAAVRPVCSRRALRCTR